MTTLMLDYRWSLDDAIDDGDVGRVLEVFFDLLAATELQSGRFIEMADEESLWARRSADLNRDHFLPLWRFFDNCRRGDPSPCRAVIDQAPPDITDSWSRGLRDELDVDGDWRTPQVVVARSRRADWPPATHLVSSNCVPCTGRVTLPARNLVLAILEDYDTHPHALSDRDPWDLRHTNPDAAGPFYLPNPLLPANCDPCGSYWLRTPIEHLAAEILKARRAGCRARNGHYYYIPPRDWRADQVTDNEWRKGEVFPTRYVEERKQVGYVDYQDHVWLWDLLHNNHWDVQLGGRDNYENVNHLGEIL